LVSELNAKISSLEQQQKQGILAEAENGRKELKKQQGIVEDYKKMLSDEKAKVAAEEQEHKKHEAQVAAEAKA
jgi:hypothetical protein